MASDTAAPPASTPVCPSRTPLLRSGRSLAEGRRPGPVGGAAGALAAVGLLLPVTPLGALLGLPALPVAYHLLVGAVLALYALALWAIRAGYERRWGCGGQSLRPDRP